MKFHRYILFTFAFIFASLAFVSGCKYNVTTPTWDKPYAALGAATIVSIDPSAATGGVNTITIRGHNFVIAATDTFASDTTIVYFSVGSVGGKNFSLSQADVISMDSTTIVVRRPNLVSDSITIEVEPHNGTVAKHGPYQITNVTSQYGGLLQNVPLGGIAADNQGHVFVTENSTTGSSPMGIHEITSATDNIVIGTANGTPWGACVGPDNNLYVMSATTRWIEKVNPSTDSVQQKWVQLAKLAKFGDFDQAGYLFAGWNKTDLYVIPPYAAGTLSAPAAVAGYASDTILAVKVYNGDVYVVSAPSGSPGNEKVWKNHLTSDSTVGTRELVLDMSTTAFAADHITGIAFSSSGDLYIATYSTDPLLIDPGAGSDGTKVDNMYKGILPTVCNGIAWSSTSNYLYMIAGDGSSSNKYMVYQVDMGQDGGAR